MAKIHSKTLSAFARKHKLTISQYDEVDEESREESHFPVIHLGGCPETCGVNIFDPIAPGWVTGTAASMKRYRKDVEDRQLLQLAIPFERLRTLYHQVGFGKGGTQTRVDGVWARIMATLGLEFECAYSGGDELYLFSTKRKDAIDMIYVLAQVAPFDQARADRMLGFILP